MRKSVVTVLPMGNFCRYYSSIGEFAYTIVRMIPDGILYLRFQDLKGQTAS